MRADIVEIVGKQADIISQQNEIIDELFRLLLQHVDVLELVEQPAYRKMQEITEKQSH